MRGLLADLERYERAGMNAYRAGYDSGYEDGHKVGHHQADKDMTDAWRALAKRVRALAHQTTPAEREAMDAAAADGEPCGARDCRGCSRCIRAAAVARRGGDYMGGPVEWDASARGAA